MRFLFLSLLFLNINLFSYDDKENIQFSDLKYPLTSSTVVDEKTYIVFETPLSNEIPYPFNAISMQGILNDPNVKFELHYPSGINPDGTQNYSPVKGITRIFPNGRFWVRFNVKGIKKFKIVVINAGIKKERFEIKIYEMQAVNFYKKKEELMPSTTDYSLSISTNTPFKIIRRSEWNANPPRESYIKHTPLRITIHHTAAHYPLTLEDAISEIQFIQDYHQNSKGWIDIGYHFLIDPSGDIFEGRPVLAVGAHVANKNTNNVGISIMGNYHPPVNNELTTATINSIITLVRYIKDLYGIKENEFYGHRDLGNTDCPGDIIYSKLGEIRKEIFEIQPSTSSKAVPVEVDVDPSLKEEIYRKISNW